MGIRLTGVSTPVGGLSWEYTKTEKQNAPLMVSPGQKIKVFISSICGVEKYDKVRSELKSAIENTQLADVYSQHPPHVTSDACCHSSHSKRAAWATMC